MIQVGNESFELGKFRFKCLIWMIFQLEPKIRLKAFNTFYMVQIKVV